MLRVLGQYCGSTALALSMHTHQLATAVWRWRRDRAPLEPLLRRVATKNLVLVSSGGSDWIAGSGKAERVEGGWKITARKIFASGVPIGDVIVTSAIWDDPRAGQTVLHFPLSLKNPSVTVLDTWRVLGMRGSGSHDILIEGAFIPEADVLLKVIWQIAPGCSGPQDPKDAVQNTAVIHAGHAARLVRQHWLDGSPLVVGEFVAHDLMPQFGGLNHGRAARLNISLAADTQPLFRSLLGVVRTSWAQIENFGPRCGRGDLYALHAYRSGCYSRPVKPELY